MEKQKCTEKKNGLEANTIWNRSICKIKQKKGLIKKRRRINKKLLRKSAFKLRLSIFTLENVLCNSHSLSLSSSSSHYYLQFFLRCVLYTLLLEYKSYMAIMSNKCQLVCCCRRIGLHLWDVRLFITAHWFFMCCNLLCRLLKLQSSPILFIIIVFKFKQEVLVIKKQCKLCLTFSCAALVVFRYNFYIAYVVELKKKKNEKCTI